MVAPENLIFRLRGSDYDTYSRGLGLAAGTGAILWPRYAETAYSGSMLPNNGTQWTGGSIVTDATRGPVASFGGTGYATTTAKGATIVGAATAITLCGWANPTTYTSDQRILSIPNAAATGTASGILLGRTSGKISAFARSSGNGLVQIDSSGSYSSGWHHIALTIGGTAGILYVDGVSAGTATVSTVNSIASTLTYGVGIGASVLASVTALLTGTLDDLRIYNRDLTQPEIAAIVAGDDGRATRKLSRIGRIH